MPPLRRVLAAASAAALLGAGASAAPAGAAVLAVQPGCVVYVNNYSDLAMQIAGTGFRPNSSVTLSTTAKTKPAPKPLGSASTNAEGTFLATTGAAIFNTYKTLDQMFTLTASDGQIGASTTFRQVRLSYSRVPSRSDPHKRVKHIARGFTIGNPVWAHFRYNGTTRANKRLGVAEGPCGIATRTMRALPVKRADFGSWRVIVDEEKKFSLGNRPQVRGTTTVVPRSS